MAAAPTAQTVAAGLPTAALLALLGPSPITEDQLIRQTGLPSAEVLETLTELDLDGHIQRHPGGFVSLAVA
ncbi:MAG: hypothetical protein AAF281_09465 [Pseudomonadota bacterium]